MEKWKALTRAATSNTGACPTQSRRWETCAGGRPRSRMPGKAFTRPWTLKTAVSRRIIWLRLMIGIFTATRILPGPTMRTACICRSGCQSPDQSMWKELYQELIKRKRFPRKRQSAPGRKSSRSHSGSTAAHSWAAFPASWNLTERHTATGA